ncbi:LysE family transporter [Phreatobacter stygius]|uniref:Lysine transporter LysE n=1 Tax=Phreatobacter stygius TaxID=1940610 RepID=A0A4D7AZU5_9HYPH|nr:LysE family transporter [Phreatobacter stygius]QCI66869.1 lysine transporter LysE [Phreatobacter stygius]
MDHVGTLVAIGGVFLLACLSPGPVFVVISSTAIAVSRKAGVLVGLGVAGATFTWALVTMLGLGVVMTRLAWLHTGIRLAGAAYLVWIGLSMILGAAKPGRAVDVPPVDRAGTWAAFRRGYLTSITNPKAAAFFGSIFAVMLPAHAPSWVYGAAVALVAALSAFWHCGLALVFSVPAIQAGYRKAKSRIDRAVGVLLILLGVRLAVAR